MGAWKMVSGSVELAGSNPELAQLAGDRNLKVSSFTVSKKGTRRILKTFKKTLELIQ